MAKLTLLVAAPPLVLAMLLLLSSSFTCRCAAAEAGAEESDLDTGVAGVDGPGLNASEASFGHSGVARATWYGAPNGAGPYDNGTPPFLPDLLAAGCIASPAFPAGWLLTGAMC
jgi:hypothetical protein